MQIYPAGYQVSIDILFTDLNGAPIVPSLIKAVLYDGDDQMVVDYGSLSFVPGDGRKTLVIDSGDNELAEGELSSARILRIEIVTPAGSIWRTHSYALEGAFRLELLTNTFITIEAAELLARDMVDTGNWAIATPARRYAALIEAFNRLARIPLRFDTLTTEVINQRPSICEPETIILPAAWVSITAAEFLTFPASFRRALRAAQLAEANELLGDSTIARKHMDGIISETVGESSLMLRGGKIDFGISTGTLKHLTGFIYYSFRVARS